MNTFFRIKSYIVFFLSVFFILLYISDIFGFYNDTETYYKVYHIGEEYVQWKYRNNFNFIFSIILNALTLLIYSLLNLFYLIKRKKNTLLIILLFDFVFMILIISHFYYWHISGYDILW